MCALPEGMSATAQITIRQAREHALGLARQGKRYEFLNLAAELLRQFPEDVELRLQAMAQYTSLGLLGIAGELAGHLPPRMRSEPAVARMMEQLAGGPTGRVDWRDLRPRFERNLRVLSNRIPEAELIRQGCDHLQASHELYRCTDGNFQIFPAGGPNGRRWIMGLADHRRTAAEADIPTEAEDHMPSPYLFEGVGFGWLLHRAYKETANTFLTYSPAIYVVEPDPAALVAVLHLHDWRAMLADQRVFIFTGSHASERLRELLENNEQYPLPDHRFEMPRWNSADSLDLVGMIRGLSQRRVEQHRGLRAEVEAIYASRNAAFWARRFERGPKESGLRVLCPVSRFTTFLQYSMRDVARAFERMGHETRFVTEQTDFAKIPTMTYLRSLRDFQPDLIFVIDHLRYEYPRALTENVPYVTWIQDRLANIFCARAGASVGPLDFVMGCGFRECVEEYGYPADQFLPCLVPTDADLYDCEPLPEERLAPYRCDVSYVSHHSEPPPAFHAQQQERARKYPKLCALLDVLYGQLMELSRAGPVNEGQLRRLVAEAEQSRPEAIPSPEAREYLFAEYLTVLNERVYRQTALEWAAQWAESTGGRFHLYGRGWDQHPTLAPYARGVIANGEELRCVYQASAINLHMTTYGTLHQRLLDGLAAGGFFLVRHHPFDFVHEFYRLLAAYCREEGINKPVDLPLDQVPAELAASFRQCVRLSAIPDRGNEMRISQVMLDRTAHVGRLGHELAAAGVFGEFERVVFRDAPSLVSLADYFLAHGEERRRLAEQMRQVVIEKFTYQAMIKRLLLFVAGRLRAAAGGVGAV